MEPTKAFLIASWSFRLVAAVILFQTLFFKFTGAKESVYIFSTLGVEPWGRIVSGLVEAIAVVLLLVPATAFLGAMLSLGTISGAIVSHLAVLGIAIPAVGDKGELFGLAVIVFVCSAAAAFLHRGQFQTLTALVSRS